jgi:hypothetical protein
LNENKNIHELKTENPHKNLIFKEKKKIPKKKSRSKKKIMLTKNIEEAMGI